MQNIHVISVGKLSKNFAALAQDYIKMIKSPVKSTEISYNKKLPPNQIKAYAAKLIKEYSDLKSYKIALNVTGKMFSSEQFVELLHQPKNIEFIIGGAFGLDDEILSLCDLQLSLSAMTLPHQTAKLILLEQIYRAQSIRLGHPYHK